MADTGQSAASARPSLFEGALRLAYGIYAWSLLALFALVALPVLLLTPSLARRRALVHTLAGGVLRLAGMRMQVRGLQRLEAPCVAVANHASYLDGVVLAAALPPHFSFVIKREMASVPLAGTLLRRIGAEFVERRDRHGGARDARRLLRTAAGGQALAFFPEGTFSAEVGLLQFHIGAFAAAARAGLAVVPVVIRGTRACLPPDHLLPHPGPIGVEVLAPLPAGDPAALRDGARAALLAALGEPDLAARASAADHAPKPAT
ncbi:MAG TPA: lysophospholipid acyltransferase family protein [Steroidobacteraceae bacterium]